MSLSLVVTVFYFWGQRAQAFVVPACGQVLLVLRFAAVVDKAAGAIRICGGCVGYELLKYGMG